MGTGQMPPVVVAAARALAAKEVRKAGDARPSPLVNRLAFEAYNRKFAPNRTAYDWLSVRRRTWTITWRTPLRRGPHIGLFREMLGGIADIEKRENLKRMNRNTPVLFLSGQDDPVETWGRASAGRTAASAVPASGTRR